jgi:hypothetical protein
MIVTFAVFARPPMPSSGAARETPDGIPAIHISHSSGPGAPLFPFVTRGNARDLFRKDSADSPEDEVTDLTLRTKTLSHNAIAHGGFADIFRGELEVEVDRDDGARVFEKRPVRHFQLRHRTYVTLNQRC